MQNRIIPYKDIKECIKWIDRCIELGNDFNFRSEYSFEYNQFRFMRRLLEINRVCVDMFEELNNLFCTFALGLPGFDMDITHTEECKGLMNFTNRFCYTIGSELDTNTILIVVKGEE